ncbi:MAG: efflux RND transporter permease subunit, partial [Alphaproteobacteria bacterium]|nr:efflux RND transporter permease subunit [Alphaproteobacteria bacterium]
MSLIDAALSRTRTTVAVLVLLLIAGAVAFVDIPKEAEPDVNIPYVYVLLTHDGIAPEDAERLLARPIETKLRGIGGVKEMRSQAYQGGASVLLEFKAGFDVERALNDVREKVDQAKPDLPADTDEPTVQDVNLSLFPVLIVTLGGDVPERTLLRIARDLRDRVEALPPVLEVKIGGDREELVEIVVDPMKLESYGIDAQEVLDGLSRSNVLIAAGSLDTGDGRFRVQLPGLFERVQDVLTMPIKVNGDAVVTIGDVAEVRRTFRDRTTVARLGGKPAVALEVSKRTGENIIDTNAQVRALVEAERANWPASIEVTYSQDKSKNIRNMLTDLTNNIVSAGLLVMVVVIGALGLRSGLLVGLAIPGSFLTGILVLQTMSLTVNIVVLFSLILAVGMLVDGAIVVTEYADRKLMEGEPPPVAYAIAARRMAWPIIASTATTLAAFAPLLFWPGVVGEFMKFLPITLVVVLSTSLAMALLFVPVLGGAIVPLTRLALTGGGALLGGALGFALADALLEGLLGL